ncbi:hypothetical protein BCV69DRAFT_82256 [Microstroma glucosiphilum]|uniref:Fungal-type protein kinase domain-containing protein n=1 Tax=Pseudomicrostroma glucosiphilum TaxID=1684307 RepID=A0A316TYI0_9BASI|nr:hypothetical protein BCV69DRAFT_82256 [Pseudomicrostroma glucosiphilum]PWN18326.1 hypothetical protein BCV69DRAFT_82256 [Pseudomicrostroma glucosiphilum]
MSEQKEAAPSPGIQPYRAAAYTFSFQPANPTRHTRDPRYTTLIPRALLGRAVPKPVPSEPWATDDLYSYGYPSPDVTSSRGSRTKSAWGEDQYLKHDVEDSFYPELYVFNTSPVVHQSAEKIATSDEVSKLFQELNDVVGDGKTPKAYRGLYDTDAPGAGETVKVSMTTKICKLSESVRAQLSAGNSTYSKCVPKGPAARRNTKENDKDEDVRVDILVQASNPSPTQIDGESVRWSNAVSFTEVKARDDVDWRDRLILQISRYAGKICRYRSIISHLHCVTWCGHTVRLWYLNAGVLACSRSFDTREGHDQIEIVKILRLLCLEEHSTLLCGRWDVAVQKMFEVQADGEAEPLKANAINRMGALKIRSGPYGGRTAVFADQIGSDGKVLMLKVSWLADTLRSHEMEMLRGIQSVGLPYAPEPLGLAKIPASGFRSSPCQYLDISPRSAISCCALLTKQHIGDRIGPQVTGHDLLKIHIQLAEQLLKLAEREYHYRDINEGNVRVLHGYTDVLLLVDFGNMRKGLSPTGYSEMTYAEAMVDRATDDTRAANPMFLPTSSVPLKLAITRWEDGLEQVQSDFQRAVDGNASNGVRSGLQHVSAQLNYFRTVLRKLAMQSHRYIDDLESALYLHVWTVSKSGTLIDAQV